VRELQNAVEHAVILAESELVDEPQLPIQAHEKASQWQPLIPGVTLAELERYAITQTLKAVSGSPAKAAKLLGVSRRTIQYRMREYGLVAGSRGGSPDSLDHEDD
jgi:two-component system response regulator HydG